MHIRLLAAIAALITMVAATSAEASRHSVRDQDDSFAQEQSDDEEAAPRKRAASRQKAVSGDDADRPARRTSERAPRHSAERAPRQRSVADDEGGTRHSGLGPRPGAWCGWYMRSRHGGGPEFNLAANWRRWGSPGSPQIGAIVVWPHHVGEIVGRSSDGQWIVLSGNDSGQVKRRPRSISGATVRV